MDTDANILEEIKGKATKIFPSLKNLLYVEGLKMLGMFFLRCKRLRDDMNEVFKMIRGIDKVNLATFFYINKGRRPRKHRLYLKIRMQVNSILD